MIWQQVMHPLSSQVNEIRRRWVTLKQYFRTELAAPTKKNRNGSRSSRKSAFIYFNDLQFLKPIMEDSELSGNQEEDNDDEPIEEPIDDTGPMSPEIEEGYRQPVISQPILNTLSPESENTDGGTGDTPALNSLSPDSEDSDVHLVGDTPSTNHLSPDREDPLQRPRISELHRTVPGKLPRKRKHIQDEEEDDVTDLPKPISTFREPWYEDEKDEDRLFLLSLLKTLKRFSGSQKLEIKLKMMQTVARAAKEESPQHSQQTYPLQQPYPPPQYNHPYPHISQPYSQQSQHYMPQPSSQVPHPNDTPPYTHNYSGPSYENAHRHSPPQSTAAFR
ncbi:hypothetical protein GDO86_011986 [Hymenochirus boettgeri]|uniref:BESS domain-containing protein n=1 Tax=Hymenochirus boettgeri TaxID=247094 RepID=A0A8T2JIP2_9PIPI|nr:hypothetical protein GDO86_011986 [Hymenochirus boettgeri]